MPAPSQPAAFAYQPTFQGGPSTPGAILRNAVEPIVVTPTVASAATIINYDVLVQSILYYTASATNNWTLNIRGSENARLDSILKINEVITVVHMVTQGASAFFMGALQIDGVPITPKYQGGTAFSAGNASSIDVYTYTIIKTAPGTFTVLASQSQFK